MGPREMSRNSIDRKSAVSTGSEDATVSEYHNVTIDAE